MHQIIKNFAKMMKYIFLWHIVQSMHDFSIWFYLVLFIQIKMKQNQKFEIFLNWACPYRTVFKIAKRAILCKLWARFNRFIMFFAYFSYICVITGPKCLQKPIFKITQDVQGHGAKWFLGKKFKNVPTLMWLKLW